MRVVYLPTAARFSVVAAWLFGAAACGSPADNSALFASSDSHSTAAGSGSGGSGSGTAGSSGMSSSSGTSGAGDAASAGAASGGAGLGGNPGDGGAPSGGAPGGGGPNAGGPNGGMAGAPAGGGGMLNDCSTRSNAAAYDPDTKHCYLVVHDLATFADATSHCTGMGAHLVTLSNAQENDFVWGLDAAEHWIGATDGRGLRDTMPGPYSWTDGEPFAYMDWSQGQPNASASTCPDGTMGGGSCYEHCAFQWSGGAVPGEWNDRLCTHTIEAVCEWDG
jgi:Lectin C-type domain